MYIIVNYEVYGFIRLILRYKARVAPHVFQDGLLFASKAAPFGAPCCGYTPAFTSLKNLSGTNALAYFASSSLPIGQCCHKTFLSLM